VEKRDCFVGNTLRCTRLARWDEGYADPWLILTDFAPESASAGVVRYAILDRRRLQGYPHAGGWQWHQTKMTDPARASRLWLAIAVATLWVVSVGGEADANQPCSGLESLPELHIARRTARHPLTTQITELLCTGPASHFGDEALR
jgi:hypothetical protein